MLTENLIQNILDTDTSGKLPERGENYCPYSGAVGGGEREKKKLSSVQ
jgi:hypothetical protein